MRGSAVALALLLGACAVGADNLLQPPIFRSYKADGGGGVKQRSIIDGLLKRQTSCDPGYGYCSNNGICCQLGGKCCSTGGCCAPGSYCTAPRHCCYNNQSVCESVGCCYSYEECCRDAGCCPAGSYCIVGTDGKVGCCPTGKTCYGPIGGGGNGGNGGGGNSGGTGGGNSGGGNGGSGGGMSSPPSTPTSTPTLTTSSSTSITSSSLTSTAAPAVIPTPGSGFTNVIINADSPQLTWSASGWTLGNATCDQTQVSKTTTKSNQWLTLITPANASSLIYFDISWNSASFSIFVNGLQSSVALNSLTNCQYNQIGPIDTGFPHNITIVVYGQLMSGRQTGSSSSNWSFEFNRFVFGEQLSTTTGSGSSSSSLVDRIRPGSIAVAAGAVLSAMFMFLI